MEASKLKLGTVYFSCVFSHPNEPVPRISTCVFLGINLFNDDDAAGEPRYYFQDPEKYFEKEIVAALSDEERRAYQSPQEPTCIAITPDTLDRIHDIDELIGFCRDIRSAKIFGASL